MPFKNKEDRKAWQKKWGLANPEKIKAMRLRRNPKRALQQRLKRFNITNEELEAMKSKTNNTCYICGKHEVGKSLAIDHNHTTGKIRGLLCGFCNKYLIGFIGDKENAIELYEKAINYLKNNG